MIFTKSEELVLFHLDGNPPFEIPQEIRDLFPHKARQESYFSSRMALRQALQNLGICVQNWGELEIENHHHLKNHPKLLVSLSHTQKYACALIAPQGKYLSIGVDLEFCQRKMKNNVLKFFVNPDDKFSDPLQLWTQKEAAFKAISPLFEGQELTLKMITIHEDTFSLDSTHQISGNVQLQKINYQTEEFWLAKAYLSPFSQE